MSYKYPFTNRAAREFPQNPPFYFCNIGLWQSKRSRYKDASKMLVHSLAQISDLKAGHHVLDIGFGLGGSFFVWRKSYKCGRITGINISEEQCRFASGLTEAENLKNVTLYRGGWQAMDQLRAGSVDRIFAVDCAYHFKDMESFFKKAASVLSKDGQLAFHWLHFKKRHWILIIFALLAGVPLRNFRKVEKVDAIFEKTGLVILEKRDYTEESAGSFYLLEKELSNAPFIPRLAVRITGWILKRFSQSGHLAYYAMSAKKV
jgi:cyclopropane fatty-acyl-phospholipid synthase-like methyltransferase